MLLYESQEAVAATFLQLRAAEAEVMCLPVVFEAEDNLVINIDSSLQLVL